MSNLQWDETDFLECLEVVPEIEEYEVSHTYDVFKSGIHLRLQLWQRESILEITLKNESDNNVITSYAIMVKGKVELHKSKGAEYLLFSNCIVVPSRFSYLELGGVKELENNNIGYNIRLFVNPTIKIEYLSENT